MRKLTLLFFLTLTTYIGFKDSFESINCGHACDFIAGQFGEKVTNLIYKKRISITGARYLSDDSIKKILPLSRSNFWWYFNRKQLERELLKHPLIHAAAIKAGASFADGSSCWMGCFEISVHERKAQYAGFVEEKPWLIGDDGNFIRPLPVDLDFADQEEIKNDELRQYFHNKGINVIVLSGIVDPSISPDIAAARVKYLNEIVPVVESELRQKISSLTLNKNGELTMKFHNIGFSATFDFAGNDLSAIGKGARRLDMILNKFKGKEKLIRSVDLAYDKLAVIKLISTIDELIRSTSEDKKKEKLVKKL